MPSLKERYSSQRSTPTGDYLAPPEVEKFCILPSVGETRSRGDDFCSLEIFTYEGLAKLNGKTS